MADPQPPLKLLSACRGTASRDRGAGKSRERLSTPPTGGNDGFDWVRLFHVLRTKLRSGRNRGVGSRASPCARPSVPSPGRQAAPKRTLQVKCKR